MDQNIADLMSGAGDTGWDKFRKGFGAMTAQGARPGSILGLLGGALSMARSPSDVAKEKYGIQQLQQQDYAQNLRQKILEQNLAAGDLTNKMARSDALEKTVASGAPLVDIVGQFPEAAKRAVVDRPIVKPTSTRLLDALTVPGESPLSDKYGLGGGTETVPASLMNRDAYIKPLEPRLTEQQKQDLKNKQDYLTEKIYALRAANRGTPKDTAVIQRTASENIKLLNAKLEQLLKTQNQQKQNFAETGHNVFTDKTGKKVYTDPANDAAIAELERQVRYWNQMYNQAGGVTGPEQTQQPSTADIPNWTGGGITQGGGSVSIVGGGGSPKPETPPQAPTPQPVTKAPAPTLPFFGKPPVAPTGEGFTASVGKPTWQRLLEAKLGGGDVDELKRQALDEYKQAEAEYKNVLKAGGAGQRLKIDTTPQYGKSPISAQYEYTDKDYPKILKRLQDAKKVLEAYGIQSGSF